MDGCSILRFVLKSNKLVEIISVSSDEIRIIELEDSERIEWSFNPHWAQVELKQSSHDWYPSKLTIRSHGRMVELAACLTDIEREELAESCRSQFSQAGVGFILIKILSSSLKELLTIGERHETDQE